MEQKPTTVRKLAVGLLVVLGLTAAAWVAWGPMQFIDSLDPAQLERRIAEAGIWGPVVVILVMALAIVVSPVPSAPIALAAGAVYGHVWGTLYVVAGAELGAICAFWLARVLGYPVIRRWFGEKIEIGLLGSQNFLMGTVFLSRFLPFISFDIVSYAAGLSALTFWRFALATVFGILPTSFVLAHFGAELSSSEPGRMALAALLLGVAVAIPLILGAVRVRRGRSGKGDKS